MKLSKKELVEGLAQHYGTEGYTRYGRGMVLTDGVLWIAHNAECFWLLDIVRSILNSANIRKESFLSVNLKVDIKKRCAIFTTTDGGKNGQKPRELYRQAIAYTDFPLEEMDMFLSDNGTDKVLMLKTEY